MAHAASRTSATRRLDNALRDRSRTSLSLLLARSCQKSIALEDLGAGVDAPGVRHDHLPVLSLQERSSDLARSDDEVPQTIELLNDDVHLRVPRTTCIAASTCLS